MPRVTIMLVVFVFSGHFSTNVPVTVGILDLWLLWVCVRDGDVAELVAMEHDGSGLRRKEIAKRGLTVEPFVPGDVIEP